MSTLINRIQRAFLGSAGPEKVRALLTELAIPAGGSGENALREARRGFLRPISDEAILRDALGRLGLAGGGGGARPITRIRSAILHNLTDSETTLRDGLNDLLEAGDLAGEGGGADIHGIQKDGPTFWRRGAALAGVTTYTQFLLSVWYRGGDTGTFPGWQIKSRDQGLIDIGLARDPNNELSANFYDPDFNGDLVQGQYLEISSNQGWHHYLLAYDGSDTNKCKVYIDGIAKTTGASFLNTVAASLVDETDFILLDGHPGDFAEVYLAFNQWLDLSNAANVAKFIADGSPVALGENGSLPTGSAPTIFLSGDADSFPINQGTGGSLIFQRRLEFFGNSEAGMISLVPHAVAAGTTVISVRDDFTGDISADFESIISVTDQIQQLAGDHGVALYITLDDALLTTLDAPEVGA